MKNLLCFTILLFASQFATAQWIKQTVNTTASFRGLSVVNEKVIWATGTGGTVIRTIDGGKKWDVIQVPDAAKLDFRDIEAFDANTAYILSIGNGESSRIYKTTDGGATWKLQFKNTNEKAFFDAIACRDIRVCFAVSDPVDGKFILIRTDDGWENHKAMPEALLPKAKEGEAAFAASGTCLAANKHRLLLVTGGSTSRVHINFDSALDWPSVDGFYVDKDSKSSGIFSIAMFDDNNGVIVGGNYEKPDEGNANVGITKNGGIGWSYFNNLSGYRSGVAYLDKKTIIAVGTNGSDITRNGGKSWTRNGGENLNSVAAKGKKAVWAVGPKGGVYKMK